MARQLSLLQERRTWQLSESTREVGRRGVAEARASLQAALAKAPRSTDRPARSSGPRARRPHAA